MITPHMCVSPGVSAYYHMGALAGGRLSHRMISSALLGGYLLVECSLSHLRHEVGRTDTNPNHLTLTT